jgi:F0F1-type ATP synthase membrane subunit c/vacuolar-type H+-ATPase subunit K
MMHLQLMQYLAIAATLVFPVWSVSMGQGRACQGLLDALNTQPSSHKNLNLLFLIGMAMMEFIGILSVVMCLIFISGAPVTTSAMLCANIGAALAITVPAGIIGFASSYPLTQIFAACARQPLFYQKLLQQLLLTQIMLQTPALLGFVISWLIHSSATEQISNIEGFKLLASGLVFALGCIGPIIGLTLFGQESCKSAGLNRASFDSIFGFTFISQGIIETPILLVLVVSVMLCFAVASSAPYAGVVYLAAAFCMGMSTLVPGISSGATAQAACKEITKNHKEYSTIANTSFLSQVFIETNAIYALILVFIMIFTLP